jgi:hypothetical protein
LHPLLLAGLPAHLCENSAIMRAHKCWALRSRCSRFFRDTEGSHDPPNRNWPTFSHSLGRDPPAFAGRHSRVLDLDRDA